MSKKKFLVGRDYGTGGYFLYVIADSFEQIKAIYPELVLIEQEPEWFEGDIKAGIAKSATYALDDEPSGLLADIVKQREIDGLP